MGRILVVEDDENILSAMIDVITSAGHEAVGVEDGEKALGLLDSQRFDVALLDVMLPKISGYHVAAKCHGLPDPPKIIIVTARDFKGDTQTVHNVGADAFIQKPFSNRDLLNAIKTLLKGKSKKGSK
jgi:DNA-binding response OmpR family regulator